MRSKAYFQKEPSTPLLSIAEMTWMKSGRLLLTFYDVGQCFRTLRDLEMVETRLGHYRIILSDYAQKSLEL